MDTKLMILGIFFYLPFICAMEKDISITITNKSAEMAKYHVDEASNYNKINGLNPEGGELFPDKNAVIQRPFPCYRNVLVDVANMNLASTCGIFNGKDGHYEITLKFGQFHFNNS